MVMLADRLADYAKRLDFAALPSEVIHEVKRRVIDSLGCAMAAYRSRPARIAREEARSRSGRSTILGTKERTTPDLSAFAAGTLIRFLDYNDTYLSKEPAHPSDNIAAALAVAEAERRSGRDLISAIALAYEVHCRLADAASLRVRGWDHVTYGSFTSALAAAKLMRLPKERIVHALGLAGVANCALRQTRVGEISMWKACAFANACRNGVFAALLAKRGMTGPAPIFEGEKGFFAVVTGGPFDLAPLGGIEEAPFKIRETYIKFYPVEYHAQSAAQAALEIRHNLAQNGAEGIARSIESVEIETSDVSYEIIGRDREKWTPKTRETADHSLPYIVGVALLDGEVGLKQFEEHRLRDARLIRFLKKIRVKPNEDLSKRYPSIIGNVVTVLAKGGRSLTRRIDYPKGHPKNPLTDKEVEEKFLSLCRGVLPEGRARRALARLWNLEKGKEIGTLMRAFAVS